MTIQIFVTDVLRWDIFLSTSTSFSTLSSRIHAQLVDVNTRIEDLYIYIGTNHLIYGLELVENFEILLLHSPIERVQIVVDPMNGQFKKIDRAIRFMRDVYGYNVSVAIAQVQTIHS